MSCPGTCHPRGLTCTSLPSRVPDPLHSQRSELHRSQSAVFSVIDLFLCIYFSCVVPAVAVCLLCFLCSCPWLTAPRPRLAHSQALSAACGLDPHTQVPTRQLCPWALPPWISCGLWAWRGFDPAEDTAQPTDPLRLSAGLSLPLMRTPPNYSSGCSAGRGAPRPRSWDAAVMLMGHEVNNSGPAPRAALRACVSALGAASRRRDLRRVPQRRASLCSPARCKDASWSRRAWWVPRGVPACVRRPMIRKRATQATGWFYFCSRGGLRSARRSWLGGRPGLSFPNG